MNKLILSEKGKDFYINDKKIVIISGTIHYFRIHPEHWRDRLVKLKNAGFNTVETYVPWNLHEPKEGEFNFQGLGDFPKFLDICKELGLYVIFRVTPYICAEWEFGGLPYWILKDKNIKLRCNDSLFMDKVDNYFKVLLPKVVPYLGINGGPIVAMQIENEYGSYGNDTEYLINIQNLMIKYGMETYWFTSDEPKDSTLTGGTVPNGPLKTLNFGTKTKANFEVLEKHQKNRPEFVMEFWIGWFDVWGKEHVTRDSSSMIEEFEMILNRGASVNFYVFCGGTNFALYNGANFYDNYYAETTSYDYNALLTENGDYTEKYFKVKEVIEKRFGKIPQIELTATKPIAYGKLNITEKACLYKNFDKYPETIKSATPLTMEEVDVDYGFMHYKTVMRGPFEKSELTIDALRDRALVYLNGEFIGTKERWNDNKIEIELTKEENILEILVENLGRINYGAKLAENKGIVGQVRLERQLQFNWEMKPLPMKELAKIYYDNEEFERSGFYKGILNIEEISDSFVKVEGFKKGMIYVNGFNLGRFWEIGPQKTLYVPGGVLKVGENEIVLFVLEGKDGVVEFVDKADLG